MMQKMRRYIKVFSKDDEKDIMEKTDSMKESISEAPKLRPKKSGFSNAETLSGWQMIRHSALGFQMEQEKPEEDQDIKYV